MNRNRRGSLSTLEPPHEYIKLRDQIGKGAYGRVYKGVLTNLKKIVAVKIVPIVAEEREAIFLELQVLAQFSSHKNIARYYAAYVDPSPPKFNVLGDGQSQLWMVMQYCAHGTAVGLVQAIRKPKPFVSGETSRQPKKPGYLPERSLSYIVRECLQGLDYLHSNKVIHRDIKGQNVLITRDMRIKLVDFGVCALLQDQVGRRDTVIGTPYWMAPEVIACDMAAPGTISYDARCDIWSMAITAIELAEGHPPLHKIPAMKAFRKIPSSRPPTLANPSRWSKNFINFLAACLKKNPKKRPRALELINHPFVANINDTDAKGEIKDLIETYLPPLVADEYEEWFSDGEESSTGDVETMLFDPKQKVPLVAKEAEYGSAHRTTDNLTQLSQLDTETLVRVLQKRHMDDVIYTYVGDILVAINPFHELTIYDHKYHAMFAPEVRVPPFPHVFNMARNAYNGLKHDKQPQCAIISGESGAGKTETAKFFVRHLLHISSSGAHTAYSSLERRISGCNPVLEAFGNAKTVMNDNSSRFGKYLEIQFSDRMQIQGATVAQYLLEKSRVVTQATGERNFHVFYYLVTGWKESREKKALKLTDVFDFRYLGGTSEELNDPNMRQSRRKSVKGRQWGKNNVLGGRGLSTRAQQRSLEALSNQRKLEQIKKARAGNISAARDIEVMDADEAAERYDELIRAMGDITFTQSEILEIQLLLSIALHLGNVAFSTAPDSEHAVVFTSDALEHSAKLLGVAPTALEGALTTNVNVTRGETITTRLRPHMADDARNSAAKVLYDRLFAWIVTRINNVLTNHSLHSSGEIGVLDIFGFEKFRSNSLEQLCINITNEHLQYHFNQNVFVWELEDLKSEGIKIDHITFEDNKPILDMFLRKGGMLSLIDEESYFPSANDQSLAQKLSDGFKKNKTYFLPPKSHHSAFFTIHHYAADVSYTVEGMLEKNRDKLSPMIVALLNDSDVPLIRMLFRYNIGPTGILGSEWQHDADRTKVPTALRDLSPGDLKELRRSGSRRESKGGLGGSQLNRSIRRKSRKGRSSLGLISGPAAQGKKSKTICRHFKASLVDLMNKLVQCTPHFVRCIKPNRHQEPRSFSHEMVVRQLNYTGLLSTIEIRKQGYPIRLEFREFINRFQVISFASTKDISDADLVAACIRILSDKVVVHSMGSFFPDNADAVVRGRAWDIGRTKVFLKPFALDSLQQIMDKITYHAVRLQAYVRMFLCRKVLERLRREAEERRRREEEERKRREEEERRLREKAERERAERERVVKEEAKRRRSEEARRNKRDKEKRMREEAQEKEVDAKKRREIEALVSKKVFIRVQRSTSKTSDKKEMEVVPFERSEYQDLSLRLVKKSKIPPNTAPLNRYMNILPNPRTRVRLEQVGSDKTSTYINANFVKGWDGTPRTYIATQGPTPKTTKDFWRMLWECGSNTIIMVTGLKEKGVIKCARYWPTVLYNHAEKVGDKQYGDINVSVLEGSKKDGYVTTKLRVIRDGIERTVMHYWFNSWPDHGVPRETQNVPHMLMKARDWCNDPDKPWIVHCSAGVGRTGTFITIDVGMQHLEHFGKADVVDIIRSLRKDRCAMVQHPEQAEFAHKCLVQYAQKYGEAPEALVAENDNQVLVESIMKAQNMLPPAFKQHESQEVVDEGDEDKLPTWRMLTIRRREEEEREEIMEIEMEGDIGKRRAQKLRERNQTKDTKREEAAERLKLLEDGNLDELRRCLSIDIQGNVAMTLKKKHEDTIFDYADSDDSFSDSEDDDEDGDEDDATLGGSGDDDTVKPRSRKKSKGRYYDFEDGGASDGDFEEDEFFEEETDDYLLQLGDHADALAQARAPQINLVQQNTYDDFAIKKRQESDAAYARKSSVPVAEVSRGLEKEWLYMAPLTWKSRHCGAWLRDTLPGLKAFADVLEQRNVIGGDLMKMTDQRIKSFGLVDSRERKAFKTALKQLRSASRKGLQELRDKPLTLPRNRDVYVAIYSFPGDGRQNQLAFKEGDRLSKLQEVSSSWLEMRHHPTSRVGLVPANYVRPLRSLDQDSPDLPDEPIGFVRATFDFKGAAGQLPFVVGDELALLKYRDSDWAFVRDANGEAGLVPRSYVEEIPAHRKLYVLRDFLMSNGKLALTKGDVVTQAGWAPNNDMIVDSPHGTITVDRSYAVAYSEGYGFHHEMEAVTDYVGDQGKLSVSQGDKIIALSLVGKGTWLYAFLPRTSSFGHVPVAYVRDLSEETVPMTVIASYSANGRKGHVSVQVGQQVELLKKVNENWCVVQASPGKRGLVPSGNLEKVQQQTVTEVMRTTQDFQASGASRFSVRAGEALTVLLKSSSDWYYTRKIDGSEGMVPSQYLKRSTVFYQAIADLNSGGASSQQLAFKKHDIFVLLEFKTGNWMMARNEAHRIGLVPVDYVVELNVDSALDAPVEKGRVASRRAVFDMPTSQVPEQKPAQLARRASTSNVVPVGARKQMLMRHVTSPADWNVQQVVDWLQTLSFDTTAIETLFQMYRIDGTRLLELDDHTLRTMSMSDFRLRHNLIGEIRKLASTDAFSKKIANEEGEEAIGHVQTDTFRARAATAGIVAQLKQKELTASGGDKKDKKSRKSKKDFALKMAQESRRKAEEEEKKRAAYEQKRHARMMYGKGLEDDYRF